MIVSWQWSGCSVPESLLSAPWQRVNDFLMGEFKKALSAWRYLYCAKYYIYNINIKDFHRHNPHFSLGGAVSWGLVAGYARNSLAGAAVQGSLRGYRLQLGSRVLKLDSKWFHQLNGCFVGGATQNVPTPHFALKSLVWMYCEIHVNVIYLNLHFLLSSTVLKNCIEIHITQYYQS